MITAQDIIGSVVEHPDYGDCEVIAVDGARVLIRYPILHMASGEERTLDRWVDGVRFALEALQAKSRTTEYKAA